MSILPVGAPAPLDRLHPVSGLPVVFGGAPVIVVFLRDLHGTTARTALARLTEAWPALDAAGVRLAAITRTDLTYARDYVPRHHVIFPLVVDEDGSLAERFGVGGPGPLLRGLTGVRPAGVRAWLDGLSHGRDPAWPDGQLGAELVFDRDGRVVHSRAFASVLDQPDVDTLTAHAR